MWLIKLIPTAVTLALCHSLMQHLFEVQIGVKLCGEFCKNFCGCKHFRHSPVFLRCILLLSKCRKSGPAEVQNVLNTNKNNKRNTGGIKEDFLQCLGCDWFINCHKLASRAIGVSITKRKQNQFSNHIVVAHSELSVAHTHSVYGLGDLSLAAMSKIRTSALGESFVEFRYPGKRTTQNEFGKNINQECMGDGKFPLLDEICCLRNMPPNTYTNDTEKLVVFRRMTTRTHGQVWVQIDMDNQDLNKEQVGRKMIIAMQFISRLELGLFDPSKPTLRYRPHGHCRANVVSCILHVKRLNMVLVADRKRGIIKKVLLKKKLCIDSKMKVKCPDMKLHGRLQRVFMIGENNVRKFPVYSMTVDGSELRHEFNIKGHRHLMNIALDETKDLIYASGFHIIVSFTLQGHNGTVIATDLEQTRISLDPTGSILYFTQHKSVFKLNTATREAEELIKCPEFTFKFSNIELFFGKIFISSWSSPVYGIIDVKLKTFKRMEMERTYLTGIRIARPA